MMRELNLDSLQKQLVSLTHKISLQPHAASFENTYICIKILFIFLNMKIYAPKLEDYYRKYFTFLLSLCNP